MQAFYRKILPAMAVGFLFFSSAGAQSKFDWSKDTIGKADLKGGKDTYVNTIRGSGQKATERINFPVSKLKAALDACAAYGVTEISAVIITLRAQDVNRYKKNHPETSAKDDEIKGSQLIVFKIPRRVFQGAMGAKARISSHPLMLSLMSAGFSIIEHRYSGLDDEIYLDLGTICPPPTSCD